jgi:hypothetical protein
MPDDVQIRLVNVEFLRPGPPHNQLLSPLTQYLAICGDSGAGTVTVPFEHAVFDRRLKQLRYETGDSEDRLAMLNEIGADIGKLLGAVPGLPGALAMDPNQPGMLIQLRLTLSAAELAFLPFELAKVPVTADASAESWLGIQTRPPVCITRNIRTVSPEGVVWPHKPRILFISGNPRDVPYEEHRNALLDAIEPFVYPEMKAGQPVRRRDEPAAAPSSGTREEFGDLLTILVNPKLSEVLAECRDARYTHVHILTHGDLDPTSPDTYGLALGGSDDEAPDVVSGERLASALTSVGAEGIQRPTVVTVASCDSANVGTVVLPGASLAHALHQAGVPLVVASQFPLSIAGSVPLARSFYKGLLWGENPLLLLQQLRAELHARYTSAAHDWASLVVYEALPRALGEQLEALKYHQAKRAMDAALETIDLAALAATSGGAPLTAELLKSLDQAVQCALERMPLKGSYAVECLGLRASSCKRLAQVTYRLPNDARWKDPYDLLDQAWDDYDRAVRGILVNELQRAQRVATLHWVLVQVVALSAVLGKKFRKDAWDAAKLCAEPYLQHLDPQERAWAHASLAELWLVRLAREGVTPEQKKKYSDRALLHGAKLGQFYPTRDEFPIKSTRRQFERYRDWWSDKPFAEELSKRSRSRGPWEGPNGLLDTATKLAELLRRASPRPEPSGAPPPADGGGEAPPDRPPSTPPAVPSRAAPAGRSRGRRKLSGSARGGEGARGGAGPFFDIEMLPAGHGDCLWMEYGRGGSTHRWLVDCGTQATARDLLARVERVPRNEWFVELFVMSHIDADHIGGALPFFRAVQRGLRFGDVWFNGWRHISDQLGARQGEMFSTAIQDFELPWNAWRDGESILRDDDDLPEHVLPGGMKLTLLSPGATQLKSLRKDWVRELKRHGLEPGGRVDYQRFLKGTPSTSTDVDELADAPFASDAAAANGSSIALLAEFEGAAALLGADAHAPVLVAAIRKLLQKRGARRLKLDAFKVSHHTSQNNLSKDLLDLLDCRQYLVSTNGAHFTHPDREAIGRILKYGGKRARLHFNYKTRYNDVWARSDLQEKYGYTTVYPAGDRPGLTVSLFPRP